MTETKDLKLDDVVVKSNHRKHFDKDRMNELADNVRQFGVLEPILVRRVDDEYHLIAGARRLRAAALAGLPTIPVRVLDVDEQKAAEIQLLENLQREGLGPIEEAEAFQTLLTGGPAHRGNPGGTGGQVGRLRLPRPEADGAPG